MHLRLMRRGGYSPDLRAMLHSDNEYTVLSETRPLASGYVCVDPDLLARTAPQGCVHVPSFVLR